MGRPIEDANTETMNEARFDELDALIEQFYHGEMIESWVERESKILQFDVTKITLN